jgi:hypothetical protein
VFFYGLGAGVGGVVGGWGRGCMLTVD